MAEKRIEIHLGQENLQQSPFYGARLNMFLAKSKCCYFFLCKIIIIILIFKCDTTASCQSYSFNERAHQYHILVNDAEMYIVHSDYTSAYSKYKKAFVTYEHPFAIDINNAIACCIKNHNNKDLPILVKMLVRKGVPLAFFEKKKLFFSVRNTKEWNEIIRNYDIWSQESEHILDFAYRNKLIDLEKTDQSLRQIYPDYQFLSDTITRQDNLVLDTLLSLIDVKGFPNEDKVGVFIADDTLFTLPAYHVIFRHAYQSRKYYLSEMLFRYLYSGDIKPDEFATWHEFELSNEGKTYGVVPIIKIADEYYEKLYPGMIDQIEEDRQKLDMMPLADYKTKIVYSFSRKNKDFILSFFGGIGIWDIDERKIEYLKPVIKKVSYDTNNKQ